MNYALMVSGEYPCVRAGKIAEAMHGWTHDALGRKYPPQLDDAYRRVLTLRNGSGEELGRAIAEAGAEIVHVHNEPNWPVLTAKEYTDAPVILNVHDVTSARPKNYFDPYEEAAFTAADAFVFVSEEQRDFCTQLGFATYKPYCILPNYGSASTIVAKPLLPHIGGIVYAGGLDRRGSESAWRDLSPVADALGEAFHVFPGNPNVDYGVLHPTVMEYRVLTHRLAQFDWGFTGTPEPIPAWQHSFPNKVFEYLMAGIPFVALNNPLLKPLADEGLGVYVNRISDLPNVRKIDPKPYRKRVLRERHRFTMGYNIQPLLDLYERLRGNHADGRHH